MASKSTSAKTLSALISVARPATSPNHEGLVQKIADVTLTPYQAVGKVLEVSSIVNSAVNILH